MALPPLIEIVPLDQPVRAEVAVPGSKSITNRALILAALADGEVTLKGALWSEDTQIMVACLKELGFVVNVAPDPDEPCNRTILVMGQGGVVPGGGTETEPLELYVGNAGTAARFLAPFLCLGTGVYRLHGVPRMHERPQAALFAAMRDLGFQVEPESGNDKLPARIYGGIAGRPPETQTEFNLRTATPAPPKKCRVSIADSSQFASALLLSSRAGGWEVEVTGENADESPYVVMTSKLVEVFPKNGGAFQIEPDASSGSYFWGAGLIAPGGWWFPPVEAAPNFSLLDFWGLLRGSDQIAKQTLGYLERLSASSSLISVSRWPNSGWQIDSDFPKYVELKGIEPSISRQSDLGDSILTLITLAPLHQKLKFADLGRLRVQECERVVAMRTELTKCGAKVVEEGDTLTVYPSKPEDLHGTEIETYDDHRMAMCFAILGLKVPGIRIKNPACVKKTFPNFFQKLAGAPPHGLGAEIWEVQGGARVRKLSGADLFAE